MSSIPYFDRFEDPERKCFVTRKVKDSRGDWYVAQFFQPAIIGHFETHMGYVDVLYA